MWEKHLCRKTVVAAVGQTYKTTEDYKLDGYNRLINTNPEMIPLDSVGYADRLPGTIIAVHIESSQRVDYKPNIDELMTFEHFDEDGVATIGEGVQVCHVSDDVLSVVQDSQEIARVPARTSIPPR